MQIVKKLNNNVAMAQDSRGHELIVFGKGIGFPAMPYELADLSVIQRSFYNVSSKYLGLLNELPSELILTAADIAEDARDELDCPLNPNLPFTLADHLNFAISRTETGTELHTPLAYDVEHLYPQEYDLGRRALEKIAECSGVTLPASEAVSIALHLINAEAESEDMHSTLMTAKILSEITTLVEESWGVTLDRNSFSYSRFALHLRYLVQRMMSGKPAQNLGSRELLLSARREYPEIYTCACRVTDYLAKTWNWRCSDDELLYLMMHLNRVKAER